MLFYLFNMYGRVKRGVKDPTGFVGEEIHDVFLDALILPGIILGLIVILMGIVGFTSWIIHPMLIARIFFWILLGIEVLYLTVILTLRALLGRVLTKGKSYVDKNVIK